MDLTKSKVKYIQSLKEKKNRDSYGTFVAEGDKIVSDLLPSLPCELLIATSDFIKLTLKSEYNVKEVIEVSKANINAVSFQKNPQQVIAVFYRPQIELKSLNPQRELILVLDEIQDPGNLGTIVRLADWYGIENIVCSQDTVDVYNPKVVQATMGAIARVNVHYTDIASWLRANQDIPVYGTFLDGKNMYDMELSKNGVIIMGNEGNGISRDVGMHVTQKIYIPNYPKERETSESLNVAVATAIVCSEFRRRFM